MASSSPVFGGKTGDSAPAIASINGSSTTQRFSSSSIGYSPIHCTALFTLIKVLKQNGTLPDNSPPSSSTAVEQPSNNVSSSGASWRLNSLKDLIILQ
ncbi:uncharacterized protein LOC141812972 [Curcuma longa]|uniref:uncharacterized protein LOC141812972 n=1 Tax=Curcuma longa TaxID=136217 RepID=UPI003D9E5C85